MNIKYFNKGYLDKTAELRPRTSNAILGAAIGGIPAAIYGAASKTPLINALKYGTAGAIAGGSLGYLAPLFAESALKQMSPVDIAEQLKSEEVQRGIRHFGGPTWQDLFSHPNKKLFETPRGLTEILKMLGK